MNNRGDIEAINSFEKTIKILRLVMIVGAIITAGVVIQLIYIFPFIPFSVGIVLIGMIVSGIILYYDYTKKFLIIKKEDPNNSNKKNELVKHFFIKLIILAIIVVVLSMVLIILSYET